MQTTWEWTKAVFLCCLISRRMMFMDVLWYYSKRTPVLSLHQAKSSDMPHSSLIANSVPNTVPTHAPRPTSSTNRMVSLYGATSGADSGTEEVIDVETTPSRKADNDLIGSNPRSRLSFMPCYDGNLTHRRMMGGRWCRRIRECGGERIERLRSTVSGASSSIFDSYSHVAM